MPCRSMSYSIRKVNRPHIRERAARRIDASGSSADTTATIELLNFVGASGAGAQRSLSLAPHTLRHPVEMTGHNYRNINRWNMRSNPDFSFPGDTREFQAQTNNYITKENEGTDSYTDCSSVKKKITRSTRV
jgi:hypothetical protein